MECPGRVNMDWGKGGVRSMFFAREKSENMN